HSDECPGRDAQPLLGEPRPANAIEAAIVSAGRRTGTIRVADKREGSFSANDERILAQLADLAAVGLANAHLYAELEDRVRRRTQELEQSNDDVVTHASSADSSESVGRTGCDCAPWRRGRRRIEQEAHAPRP
ncbi:MAG: hypothetical protein ACREUC_07425, partial [Steroidobacteraceae bacterium]